MRVVIGWTSILTALQYASATPADLAGAAGETLSGCKAMFGDISYPDSSVWKRESPGVVPMIRKEKLQLLLTTPWSHGMLAMFRKPSNSPTHINDNSAPTKSQTSKKQFRLKL